MVYCEMQARENTGESLTHLEMLREMYPGKCGYKSETGGIMANLRDSTSHKKVGYIKLLATGSTPKYKFMNLLHLKYLQLEKVLFMC